VVIGGPPSVAYVAATKFSIDSDEFEV